MVQIGVGVIGMGWMGSAHSRAYLQAAERFYDAGIQPRLIVCADENEGRSQEACKRFGFERCTGRWQDVIADPRVQIVDIATPNFMHQVVATAAAAAGKHIFCEKPVGKSPQETAKIERVAREAGVLTFVGFNYRWSPLVQYTRELISGGKLGKLTHFRGRFLAGYAASQETPLSWRFQKEFSGSGVSGDLLSHVVDMGLFLAGPIERVVANRETFIRSRPLAASASNSEDIGRGRFGDVTNEDYVGALVQFSNGARGTIEVCRVIQGHKCEWTIELEGTQGGLRWDFERMNELKVFLPDGDAAHDGFTRIVSGPGHPFHPRFNPAAGTGLGYDDLKTIEAHQFLKSIAEKRQAEPGFSEALRVAEVLAAVERSWETESWQRVTNL
jgi:predicted dehydrogenase